MGYVARLTPIKRPDRFVDVAERVAERHPDVRFVVAGEGPLLGKMKEQARRLGDRIRFVGWRSDVETVYAACDMLALTSDNEGMPVSLIEAAMVGIPAVTTRVGSADEVVVDGETGLVTSPSAEELAAAVSRLLDDAEARERMGKAARVRAEREFSGSRLVADMAQLYEEIATEKGFG